RGTVSRGRERRARGRHLAPLPQPGEAICTLVARQHFCFHKAPHALLEEERVAFRALDEQRAKRSQRSVGAEQAVEQALGRLGPERVESNLGVVALASPLVSILESVVDEQQQWVGRKALDQAIEQRLAVGIEPVQVLDDEQHGLPLALTEQ